MNIKGEMDYKLIQEPLEKLCVATANLIEREWDERYRKVDSARVIFLQSFRIAYNTYATIFFIIADVPMPERRPVFALSLPPLVRSLFEQLIAFIFLIQDIPAHVPWLFKTGYNENRIQLDHVQKYHGSKENWKDYIMELKDQLIRQEATGLLTPQEIKNPSSIGRWPTPGKMLQKLEKNPKTTPQTLEFMAYLNSWLYRELSGQTHLNLSGILMRGVHFSNDEAKKIFGNNWEEKREEKLDEYKQTQVWIAIVLMLSIASEIEGHFHFGRNERARFLWTILLQYSDIALDFWESRYSTLLPE